MTLPRPLQLRAGLALVLANVRYWSSVAPIAREQLRRWDTRAGLIEDAELRDLALEKLDGEGFHAEAAAMLATLAPRRHRSDVVEAIVALELMFDYLDGLTERPSPDPVHEGMRLFEAYTGAVAAGGASESTGGEMQGRAGDGGYLEELASTVAGALARLPATSAVAEVAQRSAARSAQAQVRMHAVDATGIDELEQWATDAATGTDLPWRELLAGAASSVLAVHALIAAAADARTTSHEAIAIERAYTSTCVVLTLLDGLIDHDEDHASGPGYVDLYEGPEALSLALQDAARRAGTQAGALRDGPHHAMMLVGVVAYYASAPGAEGDFAGPVLEPLKHELAPLIFPALALLRLWRLARRARSRRSSQARRLASMPGTASTSGRMQ